MFIKALGSKNSQKDVGHRADFVITNTSTRVAITRKPSGVSLFSRSARKLTDGIAAARVALATRYVRCPCVRGVGGDFIHVL